LAHFDEECIKRFNSLQCLAGDALYIFKKTTPEIGFILEYVSAVDFIFCELVSYKKELLNFLL
jgi:hypothetical protein